MGCSTTKKKMKDDNATPGKINKTLKTNKQAGSTGKPVTKKNPFVKKGK